MSGRTLNSFFRWHAGCVCCFVLLLVACQSESHSSPSVMVTSASNNKDSLIVTIADPKLDSMPDYLQYPFIQSDAIQRTLIQSISPPAGFSRVAVAENSFGEWLRYLPLQEKDRKVHLFNGSLKGNQNVHVAVLDIDVGKRDLQQCADAVMRLRAEYLYSQKNYDKIHFNFTSGDKVGFGDWSKGRKPRVLGNKVVFTPPGTSKDISYPNFRKYMEQIFNYAGTASLSKELKSIAVNDILAGDVFIQGGFPGHAVIVLDVAERSDGQKAFLLAQSYMPAQEMHILRNLNDRDLSPWYTTDFGNVLNTPEWDFGATDLKRF